jgi:putative two-component system hydrogenase maturation factor HypX/HoxX
MRILLLCHSFNSLSQRLYAELQACGHTLSVELDIADSVTQEACALFQPDLLIAPFLKRRIPESVWSTLLCLVVHPGPPGDRGPAALDWAVLEQQPQWGVTVLQANGDFDAGPVWAHAGFAMRASSKGSLYRAEVTRAAVTAVLQAVERVEKKTGVVMQPPAPAEALPLRAAHAAPHWRPAMPQATRRIDWQQDSSAHILARIRSADGQPGVQDKVFGHSCHLFDAHPASGSALQALEQMAATANAENGIRFGPGAIVAQRDSALLRRTVDGGIWIGQVRLARACGTDAPFKLPATLAFAAEAASLPVWDLQLQRADGEWAELRYWEVEQSGVRIGCLSFDFYNGAMSTAQCQRLLAALDHIKTRPTRVLLLLGGQDFFSNGIHLNCIEAAAHHVGSSAADASWDNINAMNDVARALIEDTTRLTVAVLRGNAGAGGVFLALAADEVWAAPGTVLNPHYRNMGNLYGSEYWTYLLPRRLGPEAAQQLMRQRLPLLGVEALRRGLIDHCFHTAADIEAQVIPRALALASAYNFQDRLTKKQQVRATDEATRPLADYRKDELNRMHRNFYGFDPSYHVARYHFVHKLPHAWTPRHLALHRP